MKQREVPHTQIFLLENGKEFKRKRLRLRRVLA